MTKQTKILTNLGMAFLLLSPCIAHAQNRALIKSGAALFKTSPELASAVERAYAKRAMQLGAVGGLGRAAAGIPAAAMPPLFTVPGNVSWTEFTKTELPSEPVALDRVVRPTVNPTVDFPVLTQFVQEDNLKDLVLIAGSSDRMNRVKRAIKAGVSPDMFVAEGVYKSMVKDRAIFDYLVRKGLNPMAADKDGFTALHWYAKLVSEIYKDAEFEYEWEFLTKWLAKFPEANINVQDRWGNTPAHFINTQGSAALFFRIRGSDPTIRNNEGLLAEDGKEYLWGYWEACATYLLENIEEGVVMYEYKGEPTDAQRKAAQKKALDYLHNPQPEKLVKYFLSLGATRSDLMDIFDRWDAGGRYSVSWLRREILNAIDKLEPNPKKSKKSNPYPDYVYDEDPNDAGDDWAED